MCTEAYGALRAGIERPPLQPYGATNPAEFFAVATEAFFDVPVSFFVEAPIVERTAAAQTKAFYDEYFAVLDLTAEFYLETVRLVFQEHTLPIGALTYQSRKVDPRAIRRTALFTVEGEKDDICAVGQTLAAHDLCSSLRPYRKRHHMQAGAGHYGVFSGRTWQHQIYPMVKNVILQSD